MKYLSLIILSLFILMTPSQAQNQEVVPLVEQFLKSSSEAPDKAALKLGNQISGALKWNKIPPGYTDYIRSVLSLQRNHKQNDPKAQLLVNRMYSHAILVFLLSDKQGWVAKDADCEEAQRKLNNWLQKLPHVIAALTNCKQGKDLAYLAELLALNMEVLYKEVSDTERLSSYDAYLNFECKEEIQRYRNLMRNIRKAAEACK